MIYQKLAIKGGSIPVSGWIYIMQQQHRDPRPLISLPVLTPHSGICSVVWCRDVASHHWEAAVEVTCSDATSPPPPQPLSQHRTCEQASH